MHTEIIINFLLIIKVCHLYIPLLIFSKKVINFLFYLFCEKVFYLLCYLTVVIYCRGR